MRTGKKKLMYLIQLICLDLSSLADKQPVALLRKVNVQLSNRGEIDLIIIPTNYDYLYYSYKLSTRHRLSVM